MFVVHECDNVLIRGVDDAVMLYCFFNSSMAFCYGLSLKASDDAQIKKVRHRPKDELPMLPIPKLLMEELELTRKELASNLLDIRFMELKRYVILMMLSKLFRRDDLIYMFRYKPGEDFEFSELVFRHYSCDVDAQEARRRPHCHLQPQVQEGVRHVRPALAQHKARDKHTHGPHDHGHDH